MDVTHIIAEIDKKIDSLHSARKVLLTLKDPHVQLKTRRGRPPGSKTKAKKKAATTAAKQPARKNASAPPK